MLSSALAKKDYEGLMMTGDTMERKHFRRVPWVWTERISTSRRYYHPGEKMAMIGVDFVREFDVILEDRKRKMVGLRYNMSGTAYFKSNDTFEEFKELLINVFLGDGANAKFEVIRKEGEPQKTEEPYHRTEGRELPGTSTTTNVKV
jgi:hypothetical protein